MKSKKALSMLLASVLAISCLSACGNNADNNGDANNSTTDSTTKTDEKAGWPEENVMPIANGDLTLNVYCGIKTQTHAVYKDLSEVSTVKKIMEKTGVNLTFVHPPEGDDGTFFNTTIASGVLPDLIQDSFNSYPGGPLAAIDDGVLLDITDLVAQYGSNFKSKLDAMDDGEEVYKKMISDDGKLIRFGSILQDPFLKGRVNLGLYARKDILDKYSLALPETFDEYEAYFDACLKEGIKEPFGLFDITNGDWQNHNFIASAFGVTLDGFFNDGKGNVVYSRTQPGYKDFLTLLNSWYKKGYITSDFLSNKKDVTDKKFKAGTTGMTAGWAATASSYQEIAKASNPNFELTGVPYPRKNKGDKLTLSRQMESVAPLSYFVSKSCENPVEAVRFLDYLYTDEAITFAQWGLGPDDVDDPETEASYYIDEKGAKQWSKLITDNPDSDFLSMKLRYTVQAFTVMYDDEAQKAAYLPYPEKMQAWEAWALNNSGKNLLPQMMTLSLEESKELSSYMTTIDTYSDEMICKFITGEEPLDNFDAYVKQINTLGIDKAVAIEQAALERYEAR